MAIRVLSGMLVGEVIATDSEGYLATRKAVGPLLVEPLPDEYPSID